jgi:hypothetical protein
VHEALFFQQLAYWSGKGKEPGWIYKTAKEMQEETTLNRYQQDKARAQLKALGVIQEERRGLPARLYDRVVWDKVYALLGSAVCSPSANLIAHPSRPVRRPSTNKIAHRRQTSKNTTQMNAENGQMPRTLEELDAREAEQRRVKKVLKALGRD